ncbi:MAG: prepilin-type N-terminal cleavage/methylation domain-containing protein [Candidatus Omnitrophota bacterium]
MIPKELRGFTLVEIMIVLAIVVILAAFAIPGVLRARTNANESSALSSLRVISTSAQSYWAVNTRYPVNLFALSSSTPAYIDTTLGSGVKHGYSYMMTGSTYTFTATATPQDFGRTGSRSFFIDESGVIRFTAISGSAPANTDLPVE